MHIGWSRIWKVLLGCVCAVGSIVLLACGLVGWGIAALEAAALLLALQYAPRAARLWKTWWFVELVLVLAATVGYAGIRRRHHDGARRPSGHAGAGNRNTGTDRRPGTDVRTRHGGSNLCRQPQGEKIPPAVVPVRRQDQGREPRDL